MPRQRMTPEEVFDDIIRQTNAKITGTNSNGDPEYTGTCPVHDDGRHGQPSLCLSWNTSTDKPLIHCHAGCDNRQVVYACGHGTADLFRNWSGVSSKAEIEAIYDYHNADGKLVYQVLRRGKEFPMRRPGKKEGEWIYNGKGVTKVIYRLLEVLKSDPSLTVFSCEGEKDVNRLWSVGLVATCNPGGASASPHKSKWKESYSKSLSGRHVVILPDNDKAGQAHAKHVATSVLKTAASVKILNLPGLAEKGDVSDWLDAGGDAETLQKLADAADLFSVEEEEAADLVVCNYVESGDGRTPLSMQDILKRIKSVAGDWPRRVGSSLFVPDYGGNGILWIESPAALFAHIGRAGPAPADMSSGTQFHGKAEVYEDMRKSVTAYDHVEAYPHEPRIPGHYYSCEFPEPKQTGRLDELVSRFRPATPTDRELIKAMFLTVFWGGPGGARPLFAITSDAGRGTGKTFLVSMLARMVGGVVDVSTKEDANIIKQRLLSSEGVSKRLLLLDNVKSLRFSWPEFEAMVTAPEISGKRLYVGEGVRPNNLTYAMTLNGASLSTDLAQRAVLVKLTKPTYSPTWANETINFIDTHRTEIIADIIWTLQQPSGAIEGSSRWDRWGSEVLSLLDDPVQLNRDILDRQSESNVESDESGILVEHFRECLEDQGYSVDTQRVFIPSQVAMRWYNEAMNSRQTTVSVGRILGQKINEGEVANLMKPGHHGSKRGFIWVGDMCDPDSQLFMDLQSRLDNHPGF